MSVDDRHKMWTRFFNLLLLLWKPTGSLMSSCVSEVESLTENTRNKCAFLEVKVKDKVKVVEQPMFAEKLKAEADFTNFYEQSRLKAEEDATFPK